MRFVRALATLTFAGSIFASAVAPAASQDSLYKRLGGYDALAAVTDDFIGRLATDPKLQRFFVGVSDEHKGRIRQLFLDLLCAKTGGPCVYIGRDMVSTHTGLKISEDDWSAAVADLGGTFDKFKVAAADRAAIVAIVAPLKADIVGK